MLKVTKNGKNERQTVKTQISNKHVIHSQMSWQYPVYSSLPLSPANAGTPNSLIAGCATLIPVTEKVNMMCHSDVVKPL